MRIILLQDVPKVGRKYEIKDVASGYARNFLIAKKLAEPATPRSLKNIEEKRAEHEEKTKREHTNILTALANINGKTISIKRPANEKGSLFAGIGKEEVASFLEAAGYASFTPDNIELPSPIKKIGEHPIGVIAEEEKTSFTLQVEKE